MNSTSLSEAALLRRAQDWPRCRRLEQLTPTILRDHALRDGVDAAVALLYDRVRRAPRNQRLIEWMESRSPLPAAPSTRSTVVVVPPLYDEQHMDYASSGRFVTEAAAKLGFDSHWLPVPSLRSLADGSRQVRDYLRQQREPVILVSLSRSSADVKQALAQLTDDEQRRSIRAWLSLTGIPKGSPLINAVCAGPWRKRFFFNLLRRRKQDPQMFLDLLHGPGTPLWPPTRLAPGLLAVHVSAFPLRRHFAPAVSNNGEKWWLRLIKGMKLDRYGPHEGAGLLSDLLNEPGEIYPVWGVPHWIGAPWGMETLLPRALDYLDRHSGQ
jgi:hypothetical protein